MVLLWAQAGAFNQICDMSLSGCKDHSVQLGADDAEAALVRSNTWSGESSTETWKPDKLPKPQVGDDSPTESDAKCYGGRFTYGQWRQYFAREQEKGLKDASGQVIQDDTHDFSWNFFVQFFRPEIWLLVLLHSDGASMASMACLCQGYRKISLPWRHRGTCGISAASKAKPQPEMGVSQLAARLRCGLHLAEELLDSKEISLPQRCCSWLDLLHKQEMQGAWLCVVCISRNAEVVENFCEAVEKAEKEQGDNPKSVTVALLPSVHKHVTAGQHVCIQKAMKIIGLPLPHLGGADFQLRSRWHTPTNPPWSCNKQSGWRAYVPTLGLQSLEIKLACDGCVELQNFILYGAGTEQHRPSGISDCVLRIAAGTCMLADCQVRLKGNAGFGVVVGPDVAAIAPLCGTRKPHVMLKRSEVAHASTACLCFMGGQLTIEEGCFLRDCQTGISACDQGSIAFILGNVRMSCREGGQKFEQVSGGIITEMITHR
eukprot:symbB.v1.2.017822.t1/scaffold1324.1/size125322/4